MITSHEVSVPKWSLAPEKLGYFRYGHLDGSKWVVTNDAGRYLILEEPELKALLAGEITADHPRYAQMQERGLLRDDLDAEELAGQVRRKKAFLGQGPHLHLVITTLRCNQSCRYCHASRTDMDRVDTDMSLETAKGVVDLAMQSTSPYINFEYTGGEPTVNMPVIKFMVEYAREKNRYENKTVEHSVVTNMTYMTEENANWLIDNGIWVCTSLDGPKAVHDKNRGWNKGGAYDQVLYWIKWFNQAYIDRGLDPELYHVDALMTTTRDTLSNWKELVDLYVDLGIRNLHLRPLNPFGFATKTWRTIGYSMEEYLEFYEKVLDYLLELNLQGVQIMEGTARLFLKKMLTPDDPNFVDLRSPIGSGTGQLGYSYDGRIYTSDEGRMVAGMGDDTFCIGRVGESTYEELVTHPTVRAMAVASLLDALPQCSDCFNAPYCGVRPTHNWMTNGDLFGQRPNTPKCTEHMGLSKMLLKRLADDPEGKLETIFQRWVIDRPRAPVQESP